MLRHRNLTKGGYTIGSNGNYGTIESTYTNFSNSSFSQSHKESSSSSGSKRQEAVQMWPQEVNLKLRISKLRKIFVLNIRYLMNNIKLNL